MLLEKLYEKKVNLITNKSIKEFNEDHVILDNDEKIDFNICLLSTGIRANVDILDGKIELKIKIS